MVDNNEEFANLVEDYLTDDLFDENAKLDDYEEDDNECEFVSLNYNNKYNIPISKFVNFYLNKTINGFESNENCSNLYHEGLKDLNNPFCMIVSNDYANLHFDYILDKYLLIVEDARKRKRVYLNPAIIIEYFERKEIFKSYNEIIRRRCSDLKTVQEFCENYTRDYNNIMDRINLNFKIHTILYETHKLNGVLKLEKEFNEEKEKVRSL